MSIIFEALKKVEQEKREDPLGCSSIVFTLPDKEAPAERRPAPRFRVWDAAMIAIPVLLLGAVLVLLFRPGIFPSPAPVAPPRMPAAPPVIPPAPPVIKEVRLETKQILPIVPASPPEAPKPSQKNNIPELRLKGVSHTGNKSWAFINEKMVKLGDVIEGAEVIQIMADRVRLRYGGVEFTLSY
ncbi:MAG: hypothetical protein NT045_09895 [Candidatus Aureabacteria bacterium]|nr:hypothetical protein [Candidatus Auribacterota bacterium]